MKTHCIAASVVALVLAGSASLAADPAGGGAGWPQQGRDPQHTNFTPDSPAPPYAIAWQADFSPEIVSAQPVVAGGRLFQPTLNGNLYALDIATGERLWHVKLGRVVWGGAAAGTSEYGGSGLVFAASFEGIIYGLDAATGDERWRHDAGEPVSASPCLAEDTLFMGTRRGTMLALSAADGALKWKTPLSWHVFSTAAWNGGRVYVTTEDMYAHALDSATGEKLWTSRQMNGLCVREFYPVIHQGKVLVAVTPAVYHQAGPGMGIPPFVHGGLSDEAREEMLSLNREGRQPAWLLEKQEEILRFYRDNPHYQTLYVFNEIDGTELFIPVHHYGNAGLENLWKPPTVCADGRLIVGAALDGFRLVRYDLEENRWIDMLLELRGTPNDNQDYHSVGGMRLFSQNFFTSNSPRCMNLTTRETLEPLGPSFEKDRRRRRSVSVCADVWEVAAPFSGRRLGKGTEHLTFYPAAAPPVIAGAKVFYFDRQQMLVAYEGGKNEDK